MGIEGLGSGEGLDDLSDFFWDRKNQPEDQDARIRTDHVFQNSAPTHSSENLKISPQLISFSGSRDKSPSSQRLPTLGQSDSGFLILGINGAFTSIDEALSHQAYLKSLVPGELGVDFVYNHSNSATIDILEMLVLNYFGLSPNVEKLLQDAWIQFHKDNKDHPERKILQICHSQGAIHVYNAMIDLSKEITDRLIILSIAPALIIPQDYCSESSNYASKRDLVHLVELLHPGFFNSNETGISEPLRKMLEHRNHLILLDSHPDAIGLDHGLQSKTFRPILEKHIQAYLNHQEPQSR